MHGTPGEPLRATKIGHACVWLVMAANPDSTGMRVVRRERLGIQNANKDHWCSDWEV